MANPAPPPNSFPHMFMARHLNMRPVPAPARPPTVPCVTLAGPFLEVGCSRLPGRYPAGPPPAPIVHLAGPFLRSRLQSAPRTIPCGAEGESHLTPAAPHPPPIRI